MMRAAALIASIVILQGCSGTEGERDAILLAGLEELGKAFKEPRLPVCAALSRRRPLAPRTWLFIQDPPPSGFEDLGDSGPVDGSLSLKALEPRLPGRWFLQEDAGELCFELTRPVIRDSRAVATGAFVAGDVELWGTWNFWLRRQGGRWRVVATTKGHDEI